MDKHLRRGIYTNENVNSNDLLEILADQKSIEIEPNYFDQSYIPQPNQTPFIGVRFLTLEESIPPSYEHLLNPLKITENVLSAYARNLRYALIMYWQSVLVPDQKYIVFHSAGFDSRIMSLSLMEYREMGYKHITDNIHFRCHQPEGPMFMEIMKRQGWDSKQYSVYSGPTDDYYDIGRPDLPLNGWQNYNQQMNFWADIIPESDEKNWILISGLGGEIFKFIAQAKTNNAINKQYTQPHHCNNKIMNMFYEHYPFHGEWEGYWRRRFKELLLPFFSYIYLTFSLKVNPDFCIFDGEKDTVRSEVVKSYITTHKTDCFNITYGHHDYSWNISQQRKDTIKNSFFNSKFWQQNKSKLPPPQQLDFTKNLYGWEAKIWSLMTIVEQF